MNKYSLRDVVSICIMIFTLGFILGGIIQIQYMHHLYPCIRGLK
jgi:hypothetical protein